MTFPIMTTGARHFFRTTAALTLVAFFSSISLVGAQTPDEDDFSIPKTPSAPPVLYKSPPPQFYRCQRVFTWKGKAMGCDSNIRLDGEKLRPILQSVPEAVLELDAYQQNRRDLRNGSYIGTAGLVLFLTGMFLAGQTKNDQGEPNPTWRAISWAGAVIGGAGFTFSLVASRLNESHLTNAVRLYNDRNPNTPIELQFSAGLDF